MSLAKETISPAQWSKFFDLIAKCNTVSHACRVAKIARSTVEWHRKHYDWVDTRWKEAELAGVEYLESAGLSRAIKGVKKEKGIYFEGRLIAVEIEHKYSDTIWLAAMAARDPRYRKESLDSKVMVELHRALDRLQRGLTSEEYEKVLNILSSDDMMIDVSASSETAPRITSTANTDTTADL